MRFSPNSRRFRVSAAAAALALTLAACGGDDSADTAEPSATTAAGATTEETTADSMADGEESEAEGTIVDVAVGAGTFETLVAAVTAADLVDTLSGPGPFTVFAPTDEAFAAALTSLDLTAEELLADKDQLTKILTYHVIAGEVPSSQVVTMDGKKAATVNGAEVTISVDGDKVMVNDANVTAVDVEASNGVIHVIDKVLLPPS
ncbi:MAG: fasciclin domain-containing protein [Acidimicrobiales bacterium]|nr:fasciclin domain-containing protein [Acidimicrobiales bacterium]